MAYGFYQTTVTTDGSGDGTNTVNGRITWDTPFNGILVGVRLEISGLDATADVTIDEPSGLQRSFVTSTDSNTNVTVLQAGMSYTDGNTTDYLVDSNNLQVTIAQGGATNTATIIVGVLE